MLSASLPTISPEEKKPPFAPSSEELTSAVYCFFLVVFSAKGEGACLPADPGGHRDLQISFLVDD